MSNFLRVNKHSPKTSILSVAGCEVSVIVCAAIQDGLLPAGALPNPGCSNAGAWADHARGPYALTPGLISLKAALHTYFLGMS